MNKLSYLILSYHIRGITVYSGPVVFTPHVAGILLA